MPTRGQIILELREAKHLSQRALARKSGVSLTSLNLVEGGKQNRFNAGGLDKVAEVLGTTSAEIRRRVEGDAIPHGMATVFVEPEVAGRLARLSLQVGLSDSETLRQLLDLGTQAMLHRLVVGGGTPSLPTDLPTAIIPRSGPIQIVGGGGSPAGGRSAQGGGRTARGRKS